MTEQEALELIKKYKLKPIESGSSFHVYGETYEINGYLVKLYWASGSEIPMVEIENIDELFETDYKFEQIGKGFLKSLPDEIYNRRLKLKEVAEKLKDKVLFPEAVERAKKYCQNIKMDGFKKFEK